MQLFTELPNPIHSIPKNITGLQLIELYHDHHDHHHYDVAIYV